MKLFKLITLLVCLLLSVGLNAQSLKKQKSKILKEVKEIDKLEKDTAVDVYIMENSEFLLNPKEKGELKGWMKEGHFRKIAMKVKSQTLEKHFIYYFEKDSLIYAFQEQKDSGKDAKPYFVAGYYFVNGKLIGTRLKQNGKGEIVTKPASEADVKRSASRLYSTLLKLGRKI
jgi:hypothetical protein